MSLINKKPYINTLIESLTSEEVETLNGLIDGGTTPTFYSFINLSYPLTISDKGIEHIVLETKEFGVLTGYLVYTDTYCSLIAYNNNDNQHLEIYNLVISSDRCIKVDEKLSVNELRTIVNFVLVEAGELVHVQADDVDSGTATSGQVLTADGEGGASWQNASAGMENPMTTAGDIIYGGADGVPTRLAKGTAGQVLAMNSGATAPEWKNASSVTFVDWS